MTRRLTTAQAVIEFLRSQYVARDGHERQFFGGCFGIFGHGNVAGLGQALHQVNRNGASGFPYRLCRNEQAMVHTAAAYAKVSNRLGALVCTTSIGPGATNMITGAAAATVNRLPVLLLPGDIFARRLVAPVLQQLESPASQDISVNDCFKPVSRYWDRINRPEQIITALPEAMRVLTSPAETGAVTLAMPQDVQADAFDYPVDLFVKRVWTIPRARGDAESVRRAAETIRTSRQPLIIAGGGVLYSEASAALGQFVSRTGIPLAETMAGKGSLPFDHRQQLGAMGVTGTPGANVLAREADLIIGIGTRYSDFTSASKTAFQNPGVRFVNINVTEFDAYKHSAFPLVADARTALEELTVAVGDYRVPREYAARVERFRAEWETEVDRIYNLRHGPPISQGEVIGVVNRLSRSQDVVLCAAGSLPGDLHKLWRTRSQGGYHLEYGYSTMGYEIAGGMGVKLAAPEREVYVMVGDGSYLMMAQEIATSVQEGIKINIIVLDNHGFSSIGGLSQAVGCQAYGTKYRVAVDFEANARVCRARTREELEPAVAAMRGHDRTSVVVVETDLESRVPGYESWWDVAVAEVAETESAKSVYPAYVEGRKKEKYFL
jgi:3D-(3,5/4)-trihydroxycyclohexane-1,2-dione acylhydrolase (decyclizing)